MISYKFKCLRNTGLFQSGSILQPFPSVIGFYTATTGPLSVSPPPIPTMSPCLGECRGTDGDRNPDNGVSGEAGGWWSRGWKQEDTLEEEMKCMGILRGDGEVRSHIMAYLSQTDWHRLTHKSKGDSKHSRQGQAQFNVIPRGRIVFGIWNHDKQAMLRVYSNANGSVTEIWPDDNRWKVRRFQVRLIDQYKSLRRQPWGAQNGQLVFILEVFSFEKTKIYSPSSIFWPINL